MLNFKSGSFQDWLINELDGKLSGSHTHLSSEISDLDDAIDARISTIIDGAPSALNTLSELADALNNDPSFATTITAAISSLSSRITALENWKSAVKVGKAQTFSVTTDSNGDFTINTSVSFTNPVAIPVVNSSAGGEGFHVHISSVSGTEIKGRAFNNKTQSVLIGGTIDPDNPAASKNVRILVVEPSV